MKKVRYMDTDTSSLYLGRVVGVGTTKKGESAVVYAMSGRSKGSRQRKLVLEDGDTIRMASLTDPTPEQLEKKDILFYPAIKVMHTPAGGFAQILDHILDHAPREAYCAIVSNGIQTETIKKNIEHGWNAKQSMDNALAEHGHEGLVGDAYNTPRIAAVSVTGQASDVLGIITDKASLYSSTNGQRKLFNWLSTYMGGYDIGKEEYSIVIPDIGDLMPHQLQMEGRDAQELADEFYEWMNQELVVTAGAAVIRNDGRWELARKNRHD